MNIKRIINAFMTVLLFSVISHAKDISGDKHTDNEWPRISLKLIVGGFNKPLHITDAGDHSGRLFVTEQEGIIHIIKDNNILKKPFLDIRDRVSCCGERGLLSAAFPPNYSYKKSFYINYTDKKGDTVIARYRLASDPDRADIKSEDIILTIRQPYSNHNGGQLAFGPDGYLYIGTGDGGLAGDPHRYSQNKASLLGKILRIDVESETSPYTVPADNPFVKNARYRPEIWAMGLRNPWRFSFDRKTGDLYIADVGQNKYEEINFQHSSSTGGENYGWNILEGLHCYFFPICRKAGLVMPVHEYDHSQGCSVTGGMVYRGSEFPSMGGVYLYSDYCSGNIWGLKRTGTTWLNKMLLNSGLSVSSFGVNGIGDIFVVDYGKGRIYKIEGR